MIDTLIRLIKRSEDVRKVDLEHHDRIIHDLEQTIERLRKGDPLSQMVRGTWTADEGGRTVDMDLDLSEHEGTRHDD